MEVHLDKRSVKQIRASAAEAIEEGDLEALKEDIFESVPEDAVEEIELRLATTDFMSMLDEILEEWSGDDVDELFEILETSLADQGMDLKYDEPDADGFDDDDDDDDGDLQGTTVDDDDDF